MEIARFVTLNAVRWQRAGFRRNRGKIRVCVCTRACREKRSGDQRSFPESHAAGVWDERMITGNLSGYLERGKGGGGSDYNTPCTVGAGETVAGNGQRALRNVV